MSDNDTKEVGQQPPEQQYVKIEDTAMIEYIDVVKSEYENERNKKQSFENRAAPILTLLGAISFFILDAIHLKDIFLLMTLNLNFLSLVQIISGLLVYFAFLYSMIMIIETINIAQHNNFEIKNINESILIESRITAICKIIFTYRDIIIQHRELNEKRAQAFRKSLYGITTMFISVIIYISIT